MPFQPLTLRALAVASLALLAGCPAPSGPSSMTLTPLLSSVAVGQTATLEVKVKDASGAEHTLAGSDVTWASAQADVVSVTATDSGGEVKGLKAGSSSITATAQGMSAVATVVVSAASLASLSLDPATATLGVGGAVQVHAAGAWSDQTTGDVTGRATWSSSDVAVATVSQGLVKARGAGTATITARVGTVEATLTVTVTPAKLLALSVTPPLASVPKGYTAQFTVVGTYTDHSTSDLTATAEWSTSDAAVATVDAAGLHPGRAAGLTPGTATITAKKDGLSASAALTVTPAALTAIEVTPTDPTIARGASVQLAATGRWTDGSTRDITSEVAWTSSSPGVASVGNTAGTKGLALGVGGGVSLLAAQKDGLQGTTRLTVTVATLVSITINPRVATMPMGLTQQYTASGKWSDNTTQDLTDQVTWLTTGPGVATASNNAGSRGLVTGLAVGRVSLMAILGPVSDVVTLSVTPARPVSLAVTPLAASVAKGLTQQFVAVASLSDGTTRDVTTAASWSSSDTALATVTSTAASAGKATAVQVGAVTLTAAYLGLTGTSTFTVTAAQLASVSLSPAALSVGKGSTRQFVAMGTYTDGTSRDLTATATWTSSVPATATVSNAAGSQGLLTAVALGSTVLSATVSGQTATATVTVTAATLSSLAITPPNPSLAKGTVQALTATGTYSDGTTQDLTATASWTSSVPNTVAVGNTAGVKGKATAVALGNATVTATSGGITGTVNVSVTAATLVSLAVTPATPSVALGLTKDLVATGTYTDNSTQVLTAQVTWASSDAAVAQVSNAGGSEGQVSAVAQGTASVSATLGLVSGATTVTVTAAVLQSVALSPTNPSVAIGTMRALTATATFSDNTTVDVTAQATWTSGATGVATVGNAPGTTGQVTGVAQGSAIISATYLGKTGTTTASVSAATLTGIGVTPSARTLPGGVVVQYTATGTFTDSSTQDLTTQVTWASSDPLVATVSNAAGSVGQVTTVAPGPTTLTATLGLVSGTTGLTVSTATLTGVAVLPVSPSVAAGQTRQFTALGTWSDFSTMDVTAQATWSSADLATMTISNAAGTHGRAQAVAVGTSTISATFGGQSGSTVATVTPAVLVSIAVTPTAPSLAKGLTQALVATGAYSDTTTADLTTQVTWASTNPAAATVSGAVGSQGLVTAVAVGTTTVSATLGTVTGSTPVTVSAAQVVSVAVTPATATVARGAMQPYTATATMTDGTTPDQTANATWSSADVGVATVSNAAGSKGQVTGVSAGTGVVITATLQGKSGTATVDVTGPGLVGITVGAATLALPVGVTAKLVAKLGYSDGTSVALSGSETWSSDNTGVLTAANGTVLGVAAGTAVVTITDGANSGSVSIAVGTCHPVINEIQAAESSSLLTNEWAEIFNPCAQAVPVGGGHLKYLSSSGTTPIALVDFTPGLLAPAGGFLVFKNAAFTSLVADGTWTTDIGGNGNMGLLDAATTAVKIDSVGWGTNPTKLDYVEGGTGRTAPAMTASLGNSIGRNATGTDTDDNKADFTLKAAPTPRAVNN